MNLADFDVWARSEQGAVERALERWVPADAPAGLGQAMRYGVLDGGKRVRPLLVLAATQAVQGHAQAALRAACSKACASRNSVTTQCDGTLPAA